MTLCFEAPDAQAYRMDYKQPHRELESEACEVAVVGQALKALVQAKILPQAQYDHERFLAHRAAVRDAFDIPWTAVTPRLQRLLYAINAIRQPRVLVAVGIFCGNTYIANAGAAAGPGACYAAEHLVGIEIRPEEAARAQRNVAALTRDPAVEILAVDGLDWLGSWTTPIDLLYLDADGRGARGGKGKSIYLDLLEAARPNLRAGSLVLAHNSVNSSQDLSDYFARVRTGKVCRASMNVVIDREGLEVSLV